MDTDNKGTARGAGADDGPFLLRLESVVLIGLTALALVVCYRMAVPFLPPLTWALTLAVLLSRIQIWLEHKVKRPTLTALVMVMLVGVITTLAVTFVGQRLILESARNAAIIKEKIVSGEWQRAIEAQPRLSYLADWIEERADLEGTFNALATWLSAVAGSVVRASLVQVVSLGLTLYLLFFFLRDRVMAIRWLRALCPLAPPEMDQLLTRLANTIYATCYGMLVVAAAQGLLAGMMFWWLGLPTPLLWGVVMTMLAVVPLLGTVPIWGAATVLLLLGGSWGKALILALWCGLVVGSIDNLLRPILVGRRLNQHTLLTFFSVVGGLLFFGSSGLILGPVTLTAATVLLETWHARACRARAGSDRTGAGHQGSGD